MSSYFLCSDISLRTRPTWFTWSREQRLATSSWSPSSEQWRQELKPVVYPSITTYTELNLSFLQKEFMPFIIKIINSSFMLNVVLMVLLHFILRHHLYSPCVAWRAINIFVFILQGFKYSYSYSCAYYIKLCFLLLSCQMHIFEIKLHFLLIGLI